MSENATYFRYSWVFLLLLPVFFVFHGFVEHWPFVSLRGALFLTLIYTSFAFLIAAIFWIFFRSFYKASLLAFIIMAFFFFFGSIHDFLKKYFDGSLLTRYSFLLPAFLVLLIVFILVLRKRKLSPRPGYFLNVLFLVFILVDAG